MIQLPEKQSPPARLIVCEWTGRWAALLRRKLAELGVRVHETRLLEDCAKEIALSPASIVVVESTAKNLGEILKYAGVWQREYPLLRWAAVADRSLADRGWLLREAGAVHFTRSPRQAGSLAQLICRHLSQIPLPQQSLTERIWASLPWE
jgi:hypothetical protein